MLRIPQQGESNRSDQFPCVYERGIRPTSPKDALNISCSDAQYFVSSLLIHGKEHVFNVQNKYINYIYKFNN